MSLTLPSRTAGVILFAALVVIPTFGRPADPPVPPPPSAKPAEVKSVELNKLPNDELLKRADSIRAPATANYLAELRALAAAEELLAEAPPDPSAAPKEKKEPPANATAALEAAKARQAVAQAALKRAQTRKDLLARVAGAIDAGQSAAVAYQNTLDELGPYAIEIGLRVRDGTLPANAAPELRTPVLTAKKKDLTEIRAGLKQKAEENPKALAAAAAQLAEAEKAALAAEAEVVEGAKKLAREQKRLDVEKGFAGKPADAMIAELAGLVEDGIGLKGTYELALRRFNDRATEVARLRTALNDLKPPEAKVPQLTRVEDVEVATKVVQQQIAFYGSQTKALDALRSALAALAAQGGEFEADANVSDEHLFKMQVLAELLKKNGTPDESLPPKARAAELDPAAVRQQKSAAAVRAATEKAKAELALLEKQLPEAKKAEAATRAQLADLQASHQVVRAALEWEGQLKSLTAAEATDRFTKTRGELAAVSAALKGEEDAYRQARTAVAETRAKLDGLKDPFLRTAEDQGQSEKQRIRAELRKEAGLDDTTKDAGTAGLPAPGAGKPAESGKTPGEPPKSSGPEKIEPELLAFQQALAARVRVLDERGAKTAELLAALADLETKGKAYSKKLAEARLLALRLNATAADLKKRVGKGEIAGNQVPEGLTHALKLESRAALDAAATEVLNGLTQLQHERERLALPDPDGAAITVATKELLALVGQRIDLLSDIKRLAADYKKEKKDRPPSDVRHLEQLAADRRKADRDRWDRFLAVDSSDGAKNLNEIVESCYRELVEIEEKDDNLKKRTEKLNQLVELTQKEEAAVQKLGPLLTKKIADQVAAREEELVLARARLRPDRADELLKAFRAKTGKELAPPLPLASGEATAQVDEMAAQLFERFVQIEARKKWADVVALRLTQTGLKTETGAYQDELAALAASTAANDRRILALTGNEAADARVKPALGGEIGQTRQELRRVRTTGVQTIAVKLGLLLLAALLLPRILIWILRRAIGGSQGDTGLVLGAMRAFVKVTVWIVAIALMLSVLGFDVTAIIAGLGIGGLAIGLAAQPMIADIIGAIVIFADRRFKIGDVIRLGTDEPCRVVGLTWRSTQLRNTEGLLVSIPNRKVTEATVQNLTKDGRTYDSINVSISTQKDVTQVVAAIRKALGECQNLDPDHGVSVKELAHKGESKSIKYRFWWFLKNYEARNRTRDEVFERISAGLSHEDLAGTEVTLA
jgi:small-conductance mechanosensitive channel